MSIHIKNCLKQNQKIIYSIISGSFIIIILIAITSQLIMMNESNEAYRDLITNQMKDIVQSEVTNRFSQIEYNMAKLTSQGMTEIHKESDLVENLKRETYEQIQSYYSEDDLYMFVLDYQGKVLVHPNQELLGKKLENVDSITGDPIHNMLMDVSQINGNGFITYVFNKKNSEEVGEKVTYVMRIDQWDAYIGMGFYLDDIEEVVKSQMTSFYQISLLESVIGLSVLVAMILSIGFYIRKGLRLQRSDMEKEEAVYTELFEMSDQGLAIVSVAGKFIYANGKAMDWFGGNIEDNFDQRGELVNETVSHNAVKINKLNDGELYLRYSQKPFEYLGQTVYIYFFTDVTKEFVMAYDLEAMAFHDALTGLPNRRRLQDDFRLLKKDMLGATPHSIALIDIDHFKSVNDNYGHDIGDEILQLLSKIFTERLRSHDTYYRYGGEEFVVILSEVTLSDANKVFNQINEIFANRSREAIGERITFSAGLVEIVSTSNETLDQLLEQCDMLLYEAKANGRNRIESKKTFV